MVEESKKKVMKKSKHSARDSMKDKDKNKDTINKIYPCSDFNFKITDDYMGIRAKNGICTNLSTIKSALEIVNPMVRLRSNEPKYPYNINCVALGIPLTFYKNNKKYSVVIDITKDNLKDVIVCEDNNKKALPLDFHVVNEYMYIKINIPDIENVIECCNNENNILLHFTTFIFELVEVENFKISCKPIMWECYYDCNCDCDSCDNCENDDCDSGSDVPKTMNFRKHYNSGTLITKNTGNTSYPFFTIAGSESIDNAGVSMCITNDGEYVYLTGYVTGTGTNNQDYFDFAGVPRQLKGKGQDIFVAKLDKSGNQIYFKTAGCTGLDKGCSIGITASNDFIYVSGFLSSDDSQYFDFTDSPTPNAMKSQHDGFVAKLSSDLDQIFFVTASGEFVNGGTPVDAFLSVSPHDDFVYVAGVVSGSTFIDYGGNTVNTKANNYANIYVAKIDGTGNQIFIKVAGTFLSDIANLLLSISSSETGDYVYVSGTLSNASTTTPISYNDFSNNLTPLVGKGKSFNGFVAKLDSTGTQIYFKTMGTNQFSFAFSQALEITCSGDNIYVTGQINLGGNDGMYYDFSDDGILHKLKSTGINVFLAKLDHTGNQVYFKSAGSSGSDGGSSYGFSIAVAPKKTGDIVYVTGQIGGTATTTTTTTTTTMPTTTTIMPTTTIPPTLPTYTFFDFSDSMTPRTLKGFGNGNLFVARLDGNTGKQIFFKTASTLGVFGTGLSVSTTCSGDYVNITGNTISAGGYFDFSDSNTPIDSNLGLLNIFVAKLTSQGDQVYFKLAGAILPPDPVANNSIGNQIITGPNGSVFVTGEITTTNKSYFNFAGNQKFVEEDGGYIFVAEISNPDYIVGLTTSCTDRCGNTAFITENNVICRKKLGLDKNKNYYWDQIEQKITDQQTNTTCCPGICCDNIFIGFTDNGCKFFFKTFDQ